MKKSNSMPKVTLVIALLYMKEASAADDNDDIAEVNRKCSGAYDCDKSILSSFPFCRCDEMCSFYGDCCPSAPYLTENATKRFECHSSKFYMMSRCPDETDAELKQMCERDPSALELSTGIPVSDTSLGLTYKNSYCAACNGADEKSTVFWNARLACSNYSNLLRIYNRSELKEMIDYDSNERQWGIRENRSVENRFYPCELHISRLSAPAELLDSNRNCRYDLISKCSESWEDEVMEEKCHTVHAPVYLNRKVAYKNVYCAACNHAPLSNIKCGVRGSFERGFVTPSLSILVNFNSDTAQDVQPKCKESEVQINEKCRELSCGFPNLIRKNGKCVTE